MKLRSFIQFLLLAAGAVAARLVAVDSIAPGSTNEPLAVIVHRSNPVDNLTSEELRKLCLAEKRQWPAGRRVTVALREPGQAEREAVLRQVYGFTEAEFNRHFLQGTFTGEVQAAPKQLATGGGVRRFVFNVPGAIGFVRMSEVDDTIKVVRIDGKRPADADYKLRVPAK